jgi:hypothetical protein
LNAKRREGNNNKGENSMQTETIEYKGYRIKIRQDMDAENPFEAWDCEPPILAHYDRAPKAYNDAPEDWYDILRLMPDAVWQRGQRVAFLKRFFGGTLREFAEEKRRVGDVEALAEMLGDQYGRKPEGWGSAMEWVDLAAAILQWGGISALSTQSTGYCQGDVTLLLVVASPDWLNKTGVQPEHVQSQLEGAAELYGHWAWGDVYGVSSIEGPNGEKIEDALCWGFYGRDHEKSGLLEHARSAIDYRIDELQQIALGEPACLI